MIIRILRLHCLLVGEGIKGKEIKPDHDGLGVLLQDFMQKGAIAQFYFTKQMSGKNIV